MMSDNETNFCNNVFPNMLNRSEIILCNRDKDHIGKHQRFNNKELISWGDGAGYSISTVKEDTNVLTCKTCGAYSIPGIFLVNDPEMCQTCNFWTDLINDVEEKGRVVVDGRHYVDGGWSEERNSFLGNGGRKFTILKNDGSVIVTNNLWNQGEIPSHFRNVLQDNAIFQSEE